MDTQTTIVTVFGCPHDVRPQWFLSLDNQYLIFVNRIEQGNIETNFTLKKGLDTPICLVL